MARARAWPARVGCGCSGSSTSARVRRRKLRQRLRASDEIPAAELAAAYHTFSRQAGADGELDEQLRLLLEAEKAAWRAGPPAFIARVSACRGDALQALGRDDEAERACREVIEWARNHGVQAESLPAVFCLAQMLWRRGPPGRGGHRARRRPRRSQRPIRPSGAGAASTCCSAWWRSPAET